MGWLWAAASAARMRRRSIARSSKKGWMSLLVSSNRPPRTPLPYMSIATPTYPSCASCSAFLRSESLCPLHW